MKRLVLFITVFVLLFASFAVVGNRAEAQGGLTARVLASQLNIRERGSITAGILAEANWGDTLTVLGRNLAGTWIKVIARDGTVGWVSVFWVRLSVNIPRLSIPVTS